MVAVPRPEADELRAIVERAIRRDAEAFGRLYDRFVEPIYRYLFYRLGDREQAEDLTELVFLKAWEAIDRFSWQGKPFTAWLYRLAHNALIDHLRTRKVTAPLEDYLAREEASGDWLEGRLTADELARAIRRLTPEQQQVIILKFLEGYDNAQIAAILDKREGAIRALQLRALLALRRWLNAEAPRAPQPAHEAGWGAPRPASALEAASGE